MYRLQSNVEMVLLFNYKLISNAFISKNKFTAKLYFIKDI